MAGVFASGEGDGGGVEGCGAGGIFFPPILTPAILVHTWPSCRSGYPHQGVHKVQGLRAKQANALAPNWGATIFQSANEMASNAVIRKRVEELQAQAKVDREWWDRKRATTQAEFMKELEQGREKSGEKAGEKSSSVSWPINSGGEKGSDEDTVLVEGGEPEIPTTLGVGGTVGKTAGKKRKGKK